MYNFLDIRQFRSRWFSKFGWLNLTVVGLVIIITFTFFFFYIKLPLLRAQTTSF